MLANLALLCAGAIWGGGFVVMKNALDSIPVNYLLALRFSIGALGLSFSLFNKKHRITRELVWHSVVVGFLLYLAFATQTYGLARTTAGKNALITVAYVVLVPVFGWWAYKKRPSAQVLLAAGLMLLGVSCLCLGDGSGINLGDALTFLCAVLYAVEIMAVDRYGAEVDLIQFTCLQFVFGAVFAFVAGGLFETFPRSWNGEMVGAMLYCGLAATLLGITLMNVGIRFATPEYASLLMSTESAFGCLFGVIFLHEAMTGRMLVGCAFILGALVLSQIPFDKKE